MKCSANHTGPGSAQLVNCTGTFLTLDKFQVVSVFSPFQNLGVFFSPAITCDIRLCMFETGPPKLLGKASCFQLCGKPAYLHLESPLKDFRYEKYAEDLT